MKRVAMEYSPECAIPYISRIDAGTVEPVRERGVEVESSGDLVQRFEAVWDEHALATHREASAALYRIKDRAFETDREAACATARRRPSSRSSSRWPAGSRKKGSSATRPRSSRRRKMPATRTICRPRGARGRSGANELVLLDLWGKKKDDPQAVYADITWVGFTGRRSRTR